MLQQLSVCKRLTELYFFISGNTSGSAYDYILDYNYTGLFYDDESGYSDDTSWVEEFGRTGISYTLGSTLSLYLFPFFLLLGSVGNVFCVIVLHCLAKKVWSTSLYLAVISMTDIIILYVRCGNDWSRALMDTDVSILVLLKSETVCKVYPFVYNFLVHLSKWLLVVMTIECVLSVKYPWRVEKVCTVERSRAVILLLTVLLVCINIHYFWSFRLQHPERNTNSITCNFDEHGSQHSEEFQKIIWPLVEGLLTEIIPYIVVGCGSIFVLISAIRGTHHGPKSYQDWQRKYILDPSTLVQLKLTYGLLGLLYVMLTTPKFIFLVVRYLVENSHVKEPYIEWEPYLNLTQTLTNSLEYFYHSAKIILYLSTCRYFRKELKNAFKCCCSNNNNRLKEREKEREWIRQNDEESSCIDTSIQRLRNNIHEIYMPDITTV